MSDAFPLVGGFGLLIGLRHAMEPDHLAAVATLVTRHHSVVRASRLGLAWGLGHSGVILAAVVVASLGMRLPPPAHAGAELAAAGLLVVLGVTAIRRWRRVASGDTVAPADAMRSLSFGLLHGLAGSGVVAALLVATLPTFPARLLGAAVFGCGTILGMVAASSLLAGATGLMPESRALRRGWHAAAGAVSVAAGIALGIRVLRGP